ncbi:MAG: PD40 domain-containing protein [Clostridia bacterium]|nr:PD40 domain-containing protein [Clostridia bacterium]
MKGFYAKYIAVTAAIIFLLSGCLNAGPAVDITESPQITMEPFFASSEAFSGGDGLTQLNLADIKIESLSDEQSRITLSFMSGGGVSLADQHISSGVPNYNISHIEGVDRMVIRLDGISNWSYKIYEEELESSNIVQGILRREPIGSSSLYLYISTIDEYSYRAESSANKIVITLNHINETEEYKYYIKINAFEEYKNGYFVSNDFYPCLSSDGKNGVLLSKPFDTKEEVDAYLDSRRTEIESIIDGSEISIELLGSNQLPEYDYEDQIQQIISSPIGSKGGEEIIGTPLITGGRFLSWSNDRKSFVYAKPYNILGSQVGDVYSYEELWIRNKDGDFNLSSQKYTSILSADYSYDNKFIAFIDQNDETRMLQIVNTETGGIYLPSDDGFGIDTSSFVWSANDNRLYAITGERDSKQLLCYDMRMLSNISVYAMTEEEYMESSLNLHDTSIYYLQAGEGNLTTDIYKADTETGHSSKILSGNSFMLSGDGKYLLINDMQQSDGAEYAFYIYDTETKEKQLIESGNMIMDYTWSPDSSRVYYTVYKSAGWDEKYPLELYYYDIKKHESIYMMDMITGALYPADQENRILVMSIFQMQDSQITVTYQVE